MATNNTFVPQVSFNEGLGLKENCMESEPTEENHDFAEDVHIGDAKYVRQFSNPDEDSCPKKYIFMDKELNEKEKMDYAKRFLGDYPTFNSAGSDMNGGVTPIRELEILTLNGGATPTGEVETLPMKAPKEPSDTTKMSTRFVRQSRADLLRELRNAHENFEWYMKINFDIHEILEHRVKEMKEVESWLMNLPNNPQFETEIEITRHSVKGCDFQTWQMVRYEGLSAFQICTFNKSERDVFSVYYPMFVRRRMSPRLLERKYAEDSKKKE